ncbi:hypothetical protein G9A89_023782 [Geosiphon pyriformis]|nr:hypothetical protein G9A89_023782 [Geosiphon pyriformis]
MYTNAKVDEQAIKLILDKKERKKTSEKTITTEKIISDWKREYSHEPIKELPYIPLKYKDCKKKLSFMGA